MAARCDDDLQFSLPARPGAAAPGKNQVSTCVRFFQFGQIVFRELDESRRHASQFQLY